MAAQTTRGVLLNPATPPDAFVRLGPVSLVERFSQLNSFNELNLAAPLMRALVVSEALPVLFEHLHQPPLEQRLHLLLRPAHELLPEGTDLGQRGTFERRGRRGRGDLGGVGRVEGRGEHVIPASLEERLVLRGDGRMPAWTRGIIPPASAKRRKKR